MEEKQALGPNQEKWLSELESGKHEQCTGQLGMILEGKETNCCLGVWCRVSGSVRRVKEDGSVLYDGNDGVPINFVWKDLGLYSQDGDFHGVSDEDEAIRLGHTSALTLANDSGKSFAEIAAFCRANPEAVFTEAR